MLKKRKSLILLGQKMSSAPERSGKDLQHPFANVQDIVEILNNS